MGKVIAIIFLVVFAWYSIPLLIKGLWVSPTLYPDGWWGEDVYNYDQEVATDGYGWFVFDPRKSPTQGRTMASVLESL